ncbi:MAG: thioredoxin-disulfide reductase [Candidatus Doudnabacteria bacterium]|nr:thioredoxin-disulfide reductase [bacterium]MDZ4244258.1 thioredoxin-disulfide reductase [Candidatus Doudnabacteria bacterium]
MEAKKAKLIIIGSGPAGLTAAIYAARADLQPWLIAGTTFGGQLMLTTEVGNYPGFVEDIHGPDLIGRMLKQAERFGAEVVFNDIIKVDFNSRPFRLAADGAQYETQAVIIATGASAQWLNIPSEERLRGKGVSSCATCDGFFFKGKKVAVVGGGDTAMEEATYLTKFATEVTVIHRRDALRASKIMQERALANPKIKFIWDSEVVEILGENDVTGVKIRNVKSGETWDLEVEGVFVAIGHEPNTKFLQGSGIELDKKGYVVIHDHSLTNIEGVFVAGDVHDHVYRQAITAAGAGCRAAMDAERWLAEHRA